jgi:hypothetical protein
MKQFHINDYPTFHYHARRIAKDELERTGKRPLYSEIMIREGYRSAIMAELGQGWFMDDADYTWFVLRWS